MKSTLIFTKLLLLINSVGHLPRRAQGNGEPVERRIHWIIEEVINKKNSTSAGDINIRDVKLLFINKFLINLQEK